MRVQFSQWGIQWRSKSTFVLATVAVCLFTDLFLYSLVVPVIPFLLRDRFFIPQDEVQPYASGLLAAYAAASVVFSIPFGWIADSLGSRKPPMLIGSLLLILGTAIFAFGQSFTIIAIGRVLQGMAAVMVWTGGIAMIQDSVGSANLGQALETVSNFLKSTQL